MAASLDIEGERFHKQGLEEDDVEHVQAPAETMTVYRAHRLPDLRVVRAAMQLTRQLAESVAGDPIPITHQEHLRWSRRKAIQVQRSPAAVPRRTWLAICRCSSSGSRVAEIDFQVPPATV
jgi:hypothetical protein